MMKALFLIEPLSTLSAEKDTSLALMLEAQQRGLEVYYVTESQLSIVLGEPLALATQLNLSVNGSRITADEGVKKFCQLSEVDYIFIRTDPPVDAAYLHATQMISIAERQGVCVINSAQAIRDFNEKLFATEFSQWMTPTLVSSSLSQLTAFVKQYKDVILKPLDGMGGHGIVRILELGNHKAQLCAALSEKKPVMLQQYIPAVTQGDKRIILINGEPVPFVLARIPKQGELCANLAQGGQGIAQPLSEHDRKICQSVGPVLKEQKLYLVGLDVIGDYLTEVNITSPTCIRQLDEQCNLNISAILFDCLL